MCVCFDRAAAQFGPGALEAFAAAYKASIKRLERDRDFQVRVSVL